MKLGISRCFFEHCRYDGSKINSDIVDMISSYIDYIDLCPEVEIGLGIPRQTLRLVDEDGSIRIINNKNNNDYTQEIIKLYDKYKDMDGFILKNRSPSCAITDCKIYKNDRNNGRGPGIFGNIVKTYHKQFVEDEGRLTNKEIREFYLTKLFLVERFKRSKDVYDFYRKEELLLDYINATQTKVFKKLLNSNREDLYFQLLKIIDRKPKKGNEVRTLKKIVSMMEVDSKQEKYFEYMLEKYINGTVSLEALKTYVYGIAIKNDDKYILSNTYYNPFPRELSVLANSGK